MIYRKNLTKGRPLKAQDVVLVKDTSLQVRGMYPLGIVETAKESRTGDNIIRSAVIRILPIDERREKGNNSATRNDRASRDNGRRGALRVKYMSFWLEMPKMRHINNFNCQQQNKFVETWKNARQCHDTWNSLSRI